MKRALIVAAFLVLATASSDKKEDADIKEIRSLIETLMKGEKRTENGNIKDDNEKAQQGTQDRELGENANENTNNIGESESELDMEPIIERGLDDDDGSVKVKYADETEQAEDTRELADGGTEGAPVDDTATDEYERSLDELDTAEEPSLDVEDRAIARYRYYGGIPVNRPYIDSWSNAMYIPAQIPLRTGRINQWQFYARKYGVICLQVWRPYYPRTYHNRYQLVWKTCVRVSRLGLNLVSTNIAVRTGDRIGFYFPSNSIIPFTGWECSTRRTLYVQKPRAILVRPGRYFQFRFKQSGWRPCRVYSFRAKLTENPVNYPIRCVGNCPPSLGIVDSWTNAMYIPNPDKFIPTNGYIYKWRFYAKTPGTIIYLQVFRQARGTNKYTLIGQTRYQVTSPGYKDVSARIYVRRGDRIGFAFPRNSVIPFIGSTNCRYSQYTLYVKNPVIKTGETYTFSRKLRSWNACRKYSFGAYIGGLRTTKKRELEAEEQSNTNEDAKKTFISGV